MLCHSCFTKGVQFRLAIANRLYFSISTSRRFKHFIYRTYRLCSKSVGTIIFSELFSQRSHRDTNRGQFPFQLFFLGSSGCYCLQFVGIKFRFKDTTFFQTNNLFESQSFMFSARCKSIYI